MLTLTDEPVLFYFKRNSKKEQMNNSDVEMPKSIHLTDTCSVELVNKTRFKFTDAKHSQYIFKTKNLEETDKWVSTIKKMLNIIATGAEDLSLLSFKKQISSTSSKSPSNRSPVKKSYY